MNVHFRPLSAIGLFTAVMVINFLVREVHMHDSTQFWLFFSFGATWQFLFPIVDMELEKK